MKRVYFTGRCADCKKKIAPSEAYPSSRTEMKPKPRIKDRYKYCLKCWNKHSASATYAFAKLKLARARKIVEQAYEEAGCSCDKYGKCLLCRLKEALK